MSIISFGLDRPKVAFFHPHTAPLDAHASAEVLADGCWCRARRPKLIPQRIGRGLQFRRRCVVSENVVAIFCGLVAGEALCVQRLIARFAVRKVGESPAAGCGVFFRSLPAVIYAAGRSSFISSCSQEAQYNSSRVGQERPSNRLIPTSFIGWPQCGQRGVGGSSVSSSLDMRTPAIIGRLDRGLVPRSRHDNRPAHRRPRLIAPRCGSG